MRSPLGRSCALFYLALSVFPAGRSSRAQTTPKLERMGAAPERLIFADAHDSRISPLYQPGRLRSGALARWRALYHAGASAGRLTVYSLGLPPFDLKRPTPLARLEDVIAFFIQLRGAIEPAEDPFNRESTESASTGSPIFGLETPHILTSDLSTLHRLDQVGVRVVSIAHQLHNAFVTPGENDRMSTFGPSLLTPRSRLSAEGKQLIKRLESLAMIIDLSHLPERALLETLEHASAGTLLLASHSGARRICAHKRNLSDRALHAIRDRGGVVAVGFHSPHLRCDRGPATVDDLVDHILALIKVIGVERVALGSDWGGRIHPPEGLSGPEDLYRLTQALQRRALTSAQIYAVRYGNLARLLKQQAQLRVARGAQ